MCKIYKKIKKIQNTSNNFKMSTNNNSYAQNNYNQAQQQLTFDQLINQLKAITEKQE